MASNVIPFPMHRVTRRNYANRPFTTPDREYAIGKINAARAYLESGEGDWFQRGHAEWLVSAWQKQLADIDHANDNIIPLRRA